MEIDKRLRELAHLGLDNVRDALMAWARYLGGSEYYKAYFIQAVRLWRSSLWAFKDFDL